MARCGAVRIFFSLFNDHSHIIPYGAFRCGEIQNRTGRCGSANKKTEKLRNNREKQWEKNAPHRTAPCEKNVISKVLKAVPCVFFLCDSRTVLCGAEFGSSESSMRWGCGGLFFITIRCAAVRVPILIFIRCGAVRCGAVLCGAYLLSLLQHSLFFFSFFPSSGGWVKIKLKLPHFHVSDTCRVSI